MVFNCRKSGYGNDPFDLTDANGTVVLKLLSKIVRRNKFDFVISTTISRYKCRVMYVLRVADIITKTKISQGMISFENTNFYGAVSPIYFFQFSMLKDTSFY